MVLYLSDLLISHQELTSFEQLLALIDREKRNYMHFRIDVKPPFPDTPENWEDRLEAAFS
jgi:hypothetical protein